VLIGLINGLLVTRLGLPSLGVTLAMYIILSGAALIMLPAPGGAVPSEWASALTGRFGPLPRAAVILLVLALLWMVFSRSRVGMPIFAVGGSLQAARLSGIPTKRVQTLAFAIAGGLYACAGLYYSAMTSTGSPTSGTPFLLTCFAAAALGLVSFRGGAGSAVAAIMGAATLTVIPKLLFALGAADFWVGAFQGFVVLIALGIPAITGWIVALVGKRPPAQVKIPAKELAQ
jgi:ribose transport system permease protein